MTRSRTEIMLFPDLMLYHIHSLCMIGYIVALDACGFVSIGMNPDITQAAGTQLLGAPAKGGAVAVHAFMEVSVHRNTGTFLPQCLQRSRLALSTPQSNYR